MVVVMGIAKELQFQEQESFLVYILTWTTFYSYFMAEIFEFVPVLIQDNHIHVHTGPISFTH